jgi:hypothetical protein
MNEFTSEYFDSSSRAWRANKKRVGEGSFLYKCGVETCKLRVRGEADNCRYHLGRGIVLKEDVVGANPPAVSASERSEGGAILRGDFNRLAPAPPAPEQTTTQGTGSRADPAQPARTDGSPTAPQDQGVAHRVAHRRRGCPSR